MSVVLSSYTLKINKTVEIEDCNEFLCVVFSRLLLTCAWVCMFVCMQTHTHIHTHTHTHTHTHREKCTLCMYIYTDNSNHTHTHTENILIKTIQFISREIF